VSLSSSGNAMEAVIQAADPADAEHIRLLMRGVIESSIDLPLRREILTNVEANLMAWLDRSVECVHLVATSHQSIIGVVLVKDFWNLCSLFVEPSRQGRGVGRALVEDAAAACASRGTRKALVLNAYPSAIGFYERLGFSLAESGRHLPSGIRRMERPLERRGA